jgi:squalene-associated FAD-dependent desaturase
MSAAYHLAEKGRRVCLLESGSLLGGRARSFQESRSGLELDWGPHLFMKANPSLRDFLERIGAVSSLHFAPSLDLTFRLHDRSLKEGVRIERLRFPRWGGALGGVLALFRWGGPPLSSRYEILKGLLRSISEEKNSNANNETVAELLYRLGQGESSQAWFWEPFSRAVLNLPMEMGSGVLFRRVVGEAFGAGPDGATLGSPMLPMRAFWADRAGEGIRRLGGEVRMKTPVQKIQVQAGAVTGVTLSGGEFLEAAEVIMAVPPPTLLAMLPEDISRQVPWVDFKRFTPSPIASAYLWLDRPSAGPVFEALVHEPWQWLFRPGNHRESEQEPLALLAGGVDSVAAASKAEMEASAEETAARLLPGAAIRRMVVVREKAATWANGAEEQEWRPPPKSPISGLFLAGDWTATGLPATCEGAVRSGRKAADAILGEN